MPPARNGCSPRLPDVTAERIAICPGTQGALVAALTLLVRRGDTVCVEALAYPGFLALAAHLGIHLQPVAMDDDGLLPDSFEAACKAHRPKALYCTPTFHNPTTATIPLARRKRLIEIARRHDVAIIEDDAYGALAARAGRAAGRAGARLRLSHCRSFQMPLARACASPIWCCRMRASGPARRMPFALLPAWRRR